MEFLYELSRGYPILTNNTHAMVFLILVSLYLHDASWNAYLLSYAEANCYYA